MFYTVGKLGALALYAATLASYLMTLPLPAEVLYWMRAAVAVLFAAHALEVVAFRRQVALYQGPFAVSALLTLLFGFLHWKPLVDARR